MVPSNRTIFVQALAMGVAVGVFGVSYGVLAVAAGIPVAMVVAMSVLVFSGGAQFAAVGIVAAGGGPWAAVVPGLLLSTRFVPLGLAAAPFLGGSARLRAVAAHLLIDESAAVALAQPDARSARRAFWSTGLILGVTWLVGTVVGAFAGTVLQDPAALGLDAAFPAGFLALLAPLVRTRRQRVAAVAGAALAVATTPVLPLGLPVVVAVAGALAALAVPRGPVPPTGPVPRGADRDAPGGDTAAGAGDRGAGAARGVRP